MEFKLTRKEANMLYKGTIKKFVGQWGSGLGTLVVEHEGKTLLIPCENAPTVRALENAFGEVITDGHTANGSGYKDKEIYYTLDFVGVLEAFVPVEEASPELEEKYQRGGEV